MATIPGLNVSILKHFQENELHDLHTLLSSMELSKIRGLMGELDTTLQYMTKVLLLEGVNQDYDVLPYLQDASTAISELKEVHPDEFQLERVDNALRKLIDFYSKDILLTLPGNTTEEQTYHLLNNFKDNSKEKEVFTNYYNTCLYNTFRFQTSSRMTEDTPNGRVDACYRIPRDLRDYTDKDSVLSKYTALITSFTLIKGDKDGKSFADLLREIDRMGVPTIGDEIPPDELKLIMLNLMFFMSMNLFSRREPDLKELLDIPFEVLDGKSEPKLDRFKIYRADILNDAPMRERVMLNKWWSAYVQHHNRMMSETQLYGFTPGLHESLNLGRPIEVIGTDGRPTMTMAEYDHDYLFNSLLEFAKSVYRDDTVPKVTESECLSLVNIFIENLSKGQRQIERVIDYSKTDLKPAYDLIVNTTTLVNNLNTHLTKLMKNSEIDVDQCSRVFNVCTVLTTILDNKDLSLVPIYADHWNRVPELLKGSATDLAFERNTLIYVQETLSQLYETVRDKDDVFTDIPFFGSTLNNFLESGRGNCSGARANSLHHVVVVTDNYNVVHELYPETVRYVKTLKGELETVIDTLKDRLHYISEYEASYFTKDTNFETSKKAYVKFLRSVDSLAKEEEGFLRTGINYRYGHLEVGSRLSEVDTRKEMLTPVKIEQSKNKSNIESTLEDFQSWYIDLEAREFLLDCVTDINYSKVPIW